MPFWCLFGAFFESQKPPKRQSLFEIALSSGRSSTVVVPGYRKPFETEANHQQHCCREAEAGYLAPETFIQFQSKCHLVQLIIFLKVRNVERI